MPVVPRNTISEPQVPRLPQVGMAKPRIAEALGSVAGALGGRAASIGRLASTAGDMIGVLERNYERESAIAGAKYKGEMAKANAISSIGSTLVQTGETIDRIYERRSREQADNALTEYTDYLTRSSTGFQDQQSGQRVPGTLEAPYSPGNEKDEATGPSIATAKAVKEWMENKDGTYAKMSPRAKEEFDRRAARITQSVMDRAMRQEYDQMQAFRQANDKAAFEADRKHVASLGVDVSPAGNEQWMIDMMAARDAQVMREIGRYQKDPSNQSVKNAEWANPEVAKYAAFASRNLMETFTADRVEALLLAASNEPDDSRREALLATAVGTAGMEHAGKRVLAEEAFQKAKLEADKVRLQASSMKAAQLKTAIDRAHDLKAQTILTGDPKAAQELDGLLQTLPPHVAIEVRQTQEAAHYQREMAMLEDAVKTYEASVGTPNQINAGMDMRLVAMQFTNKRAKVEAQAVINGASSKTATAFQTARADDLEMAVWLGGRKGPDGSFISMTDAQLATEVANSDILPTRARDLMEKIAERKDRDPVVEKKIYEALDGILGIDADASFKLVDGMFEYETTKKEGRDVPVTPEDYVLAKVDFSGTKSPSIFDWRFNPIEDRSIKLKSELIRKVAQDAYDYYRQQKTLSKDGKEPMSIEAYIRKRLMPEENEDARAWTEADIDRRIKQGQVEREKMRLLFLEQMSNANEPATATP